MKINFRQQASIQGYLYFMDIDGQTFNVHHKLLAEFYYDKPKLVSNIMVELEKLFPDEKIENITKDTENGFDRSSSRG